jgi:class 3 adenylate cyclase
MEKDPAHLQALLDLNAQVDATVEDCLRHRMSLKDAMTVLLPTLCSALGARGAFLHTFHEDLELASFTHPSRLETPWQVDVLRRCADQTREEVTLAQGEDVVLARPLDVAGEWFGVAALVFARGEVEARGAARLHELLDVACEELDNFLFIIRQAREKHRIMMALGEALKHRVLGEGVKAAVGVLASAMPLQRLLLVSRAQEGGRTVHAQVFEGGTLKTSTMDGTLSTELLRTLQREAHGYLQNGERALLKRFGFEAAREEVLINGITQASVVGKVLVTNAAGSFNTHDRDLLGGFAGFIRQRVVDFNKEWRTLAHTFREDDVAELLQHDDYVARYLTPHEEQVAILYCDIAGFTRLSEQVLKTPSRVADLVEGWSRRVVDLVWEHGGAFDKMVGDCVIALFGPPFYRASPGERLQNAVKCAHAIRKVTTELPQLPEFAHLRESGLACTTGVNLAPLFVGMFGPNDNFTGFSSGMNNTARLQGCAERDEIVVMVDSIAMLPPGHGFTFGPEKQAKVKNVADPLRFRPLL